VAITRRMRDLDLNVKMYASTIGVGQPEFHERLGRIAEFVYGPSQWEPEFLTLRAGGLIPIARQYPGAREFIEAHTTGSIRGVIFRITLPSATRAARC